MGILCAFKLLDSAKYPSQLEVLYNGPEMPYEHDRNGFEKLLIPPFRKYIHYRGYFSPIFVKKAKRKISQTLKTLKFVEISKVSVSSEKTRFCLLHTFFDINQLIRFLMS